MDHSCSPVIVISTDVIVGQPHTWERSCVSVAVPTYLPSKAIGAAGPCADEVAAGTASALRITKARSKPRNLIAVPPGSCVNAGFDTTARTFKSDIMS